MILSWKFDDRYVPVISLFSQVTSEYNLGTWLNEEYGDRAKMKAALERVVWARQTTDCPNLIGIEPVATINECLVGIHQLDYSRDAKHGCFLIEIIVDSGRVSCNIEGSKFLQPVFSWQLRLSPHGHSDPALQEHPLPKL